MNILHQILMVRKESLKRRNGLKYLLLSSDQHKQLVKEVKEKFNSPWITREDFNKTVEKLSKRIFGMDIIGCMLEAPSGEVLEL